METDKQKAIEMATDSDLGILINGAVRFAIGTNTSMVRTIYDFIMKHYSVLDNRMIAVILNDIRWENRNNDLMLKETWLEVESLLSNELYKRTDPRNNI